MSACRMGGAGLVLEIQGLNHRCQIVGVPVHVRRGGTWNVVAAPTLRSPFAARYAAEAIGS
jgi:hypothetical protein